MEKWLAQQLQSRQSGKGRGKGKSSSSPELGRGPKRQKTDSNDLRDLTLAIGDLTLENSQHSRFQSGGLLRTCLAPVDPFQELLAESIQITTPSTGADSSLDNALA